MAIFQITGVSRFPLDFQSPVIPVLSFLTGLMKTLHIPYDTVPPSLLEMSPLPSLTGSLKLNSRFHTSHVYMSKALQSTPLN